MKILIFLIVIYASQIFGQNIFYQDSLKTKIGDTLIQVIKDGQNYFVYNGKISNNGEFIAGFLINDEISNFINVELESNTILDFYEFSNIEFAIYSIVKNKILFLKQLDTFPEFQFSGNSKYLFLSLDEKIDLVDLANEKIFSDITVDFHEIKFHKNKLYGIKIFDKGFEIKEYSFVKQKFCFYFEEYSSIVEVDKKIDFYLVDNTILIAKTTLDGLLIFTSIERQPLKYNSRFSKNSKVLYSSNKVFIYGSRENKKFASVFIYYEKENFFKELFKTSDIPSFERMFSSISAVADSPNYIFFLLQSVELSWNNLVKYEKLGHRFEFVTKKGYITKPIGYCLQ